MSDLYIIVQEGKKELGNDPRAIKRWAELSGVDIDSIKEDTPFDIDIADRLLSTIPIVKQEMLEGKLSRAESSDKESIEKSLEDLLSSVQEEESILSKAVSGEEQEVTQEVKPETTESVRKYSVIRGEVQLEISDEVITCLRFDGSKVEVLKGEFTPEWEPFLELIMSAGPSGLVMRTGRFSLGAIKYGDGWLVVRSEGSMGMALAWLRKISRRL